MIDDPSQIVPWFRDAGQPPCTEPLAGDLETDVAVIGAGFTGLTAALHLAGRGYGVRVLEAARVAAGASGVNAGFVVPNFAKADPAQVRGLLGSERGHRLLSLVGEGADRVFETIARHSIECDGRQTGWLHIAHDAASAGVLARRAAAWRALGRPVRFLSATEARDLTAARNCAGGLLDESGGTINPAAYAWGLARAAHAAGAVIHEKSAVTAVRRAGECWELEVGGHRVAARIVLLCTNASATGVARLLYRAIVPLHVFQAATTPVSVETANRIAPRGHPAADTRANLFTYRLDSARRLISGGMPVIPVRAHNRMGRAIAGRLARELDLPKPPRVEHVWDGYAAMTRDFIPHLYRFGPNFIGGIGCNGRGIAMTAMLGEVLADAAEGRDDLPVPEAPATPLPLHGLARTAPSFAIMHARFKDWRAGI